MPALGKGKFNAALRAQFLAALRTGMTRAAAAGMVGVDAATITHCCARSQAFAKQCNVAEQEAEAAITAIVIRALPSDPRLALEWLKRRRRAAWGDRLDVRHLTDEQVVRLLEGEADGGGGTERAERELAGTGGNGHQEL